MTAREEIAPTEKGQWVGCPVYRCGNVLAGWQSLVSGVVPRLLRLSSTAMVSGCDSIPGVKHSIVLRGLPVLGGELPVIFRD